MRFSYVFYTSGNIPVLRVASDIIYRHLTPFLLPISLGTAIQGIIIGIECCVPSNFYRQSDSKLRVTDKSKVLVSGLDVSFLAQKTCVLPYYEVREMSTSECVRLLFSKLKEFADQLLVFKRKIDFDRIRFKELILLAEQELLKELAE